MFFMSFENSINPVISDVIKILSMLKVLVRRGRISNETNIEIRILTVVRKMSNIAGLETL